MTEKCSIEQVFADIAANYAEIENNLCKAAAAAGRRREDVRLMAVTKTVSPVFINHALKLGVDLIGENKVQELLSKLEFLDPPGVSKHLIGHLQSNKARKIIDVVDMIESVDSISLAREISRQAVLHEKTMDVLLEVNIAEEASKTGFPPGSLMAAAPEIAEMPGIRMRGLMTVPPICESPLLVRAFFSAARRLYEDLRPVGGADWDTLSMGMSADYADAVAEGATLVRIGSALFGRRSY